MKSGIGKIGFELIKPGGWLEVASITFGSIVLFCHGGVNVKAAALWIFLLILQQAAF